MKSYQVIAAGAAALLFGGLQAIDCSAASLAPVKLTLQRAGKSSFASAPTTNNHATQPDEIEFQPFGDTDSGGGDNENAGVNRTLPGAVTGHGKPVKANTKPKSNPALGTHFEGLNFNNQRFANGGNQFSVEPPDQGLCVGNGFVLETVNDVLRVTTPMARRLPALSISTRSTVIRLRLCERALILASAGRPSPTHHASTIR